MAARVSLIFFTGKPEVYDFGVFRYCQAFARQSLLYYKAGVLRFAQNDKRKRYNPAMNDRELLREALAEARLGLKEGGLPIGSVLADSKGRIVARGRNLRVQTGDPTAHAEVACIRNAGRRRDWQELTLVSTLSPCIMCTGTALLFRVPRVIVGENQNFMGAEDLFRERGVTLSVLDDSECIELMRRFIAEHPDLWNEDIGL
jgi:cytosine/creatinine deaminase